MRNKYKNEDVMDDVIPSHITAFDVGSHRPMTLIKKIDKKGLVSDKDLIV